MPAREVRERLLQLADFVAERGMSAPRFGQVAGLGELLEAKRRSPRAVAAEGSGGSLQGVRRALEHRAVACVQRLRNLRHARGTVLQEQLRLPANEGGVALHQRQQAGLEQ